MFSELRCAFTMGSILLSYAKPIVEDRLCSVGEELACYSAQAESYPLCVPMKFFLVCGAFFSFFFFLLHWQSGVFVTETLWPSRSKIFAIWPITGRFADQTVIIFVDSYGMNFYLKTFKKYPPLLIECISCAYLLSLLRAEGLKMNELFWGLKHSISGDAIYLYLGV